MCSVLCQGNSAICWWAMALMPAEPLVTAEERCSPGGAAFLVWGDRHRQERQREERCQGETFALALSKAGEIKITVTLEGCSRSQKCQGFVRCPPLSWANVRLTTPEPVRDMSPSLARSQTVHCSTGRCSLGSAATARVWQGPQPFRCHPALPCLRCSTAGGMHTRLCAQELIPAQHPGVPRGCYSLETAGTAESVSSHWAYVPSYTHRICRAVSCPCNANTNSCPGHSMSLHGGKNNLSDQG